MTLLVLLEHDRGVLVEAAREALTAARALSAQLGDTVHGVVIGAEADADALAELGPEVGHFGADVLHLATHALITDYGPDAWAECLAQLADEAEADVVVTSGTDRGNEVMAHVAARADLPFVANALAVETADGSAWLVTRIQWGGSLLEDVELRAERKLVSFAHHAVTAEPVVSPAEPRIEQFEPDLDSSVTVTIIRDRAVSAGGITLATAPVVVSGGRGVGSAEGFAVLEELAQLLGGVVGCSRAVTNNGWRPHSDQVGQTGTRIAPELYIANGISGAIQHWVGAMAAKKILAINIDPEANMVAKADYAVIADLHQVIPAISAEIRRRQR